MPTMTRTFVLDLLERAARTFAQAFLAVLVAQWAGSGLGVDVLDFSAWQKLLLSAATAGLAAVASLGMSLLAGFKTGTASAVPAVAAQAVTGRHELVAAAPADGEVLDGTGGV